MDKRVILAAFVMLAASTAGAQAVHDADFTETVEYSTDKYKVETNGFWSNWFITAGAGGQILFGDHDRQVGFGDRLAPALDIAVGKWLSPVIGVRLEYSGLSVKGATRWGLAHSTGEQVPGWGDGLFYSKFNMFNLHADALFNLSNVFCGYNEKRIWNSSVYGGAGWARTWEAPSADGLTLNAGWLNTFRLCSALDLNIDVRATMVDDGFDSEEGEAKYDGLLTATVGLTYKFKPRGWNRSKTVVRTYYNNDEINAMREKLNAMSAENARLQEALAAGNKADAERIVKQIASSNLVVFPIGKSTLSNEARVNLGMLAEVIKQGNPKSVYYITGYADAGTGSQKMNERLSRKRADVVRDCLVKEFGISPSQLKVDYKGGVDNMFYDDPRLSRAVITRME